MGHREIGPPHAHYFYANSSVELQHFHFVELFTYPTNGTSTDGHTHRFQGITKRMEGHFHRFFGETGPAILLPNHQHIHAVSSQVDDEPFEFFEGYYETVLGIRRHTHAFSGITGTPLGIEPVNW